MEGLVLKQEAAVYRYALISGIVEIAEVTAWADAWIWRLDEYPDALIDVSLSASRPDQLLMALGDLAEPSDSLSIFATLCRMMAHFLEKHPEKFKTVTQLLERLALDDTLPEECSSEAFRFDDARCLAEDGVLDLKVVHDEVMAFLTLHAS